MGIGRELSIAEKKILLNLARRKHVKMGNFENFKIRAET